MGFASFSTFGHLESSGHTYPCTNTVPSPPVNLAVEEICKIM